MPMITPDLNVPKHPWYQRRNHVKIARQAESRQYLDLAFIPSVKPAGWNYGLRIGSHANGNTGMQAPERPAGPIHAFGDINPDTFSGQPITELSVTSTDIALIYFNQPLVQLPGINTVTLTAQGFGGSVIMAWEAGFTRYRANTQTAFGTFIRANVGKVVGFTLVGSALLRFEQPYPWEAFGTQTQINDWVEETDLDVPPGWFAMSLVAKKAYLAATYGEPAP